MITLQPLSTVNAIPEHSERLPSEFEIQSTIYQMLLDAGLKVRGEMQCDFEYPRGHCRFDIVIYEGEKPVHILEVKARSVRHKEGAHSTRQGYRYRQFGVPVTFVYGVEDAVLFREYFILGRQDAASGDGSAGDTGPVRGFLDPLLAEGSEEGCEGSVGQDQPACYAEILTAVCLWRPVFLARGDTRFTPLPATWLNGERWTDELPVELRSPVAAHQPAVMPDMPRKSGEIPQHVKDQLAKLRR